jgi:hypothetical protein
MPWWLLLAALLSALTATPVTAQQHSYAAAPHLIALDAPDLANERVARPGDVLFRQQARVLGIVSLNALATGEIPLERDNTVRVSVAADDRLYSVAIGTMPRARVYCSFRVIAVAYGFDPGFARVCLGDRDGDELFDELWHIRLPPQYLTSAGDLSPTSAQTIGGGFISRDGPLAENVSYSRSDESAFPSVTLELVYSPLLRRPADASRVMFSTRAIVEGGAAAGFVTDSWSVQRLPSSDERYASIISGAVVEYTFADGDIAYRVVRPFPPNTEIEGVTPVVVPARPTPR